jgi:Ca2+-binding RTX toxin-like protein
MGNDTLTANYSPLDVVATGANRDALIIGGAGDDFITGGGGVTGDTLVGWDFLRGRSGNDTINGLDGADQVYGDKGDDILYGGTAFDEVKGGEGNDQTWGGDGNMLDVFVDSADYLVGGPGNDIQVGEEGNDEIVGASGDDVQRGSSGNDWICGGTGADDAYGETGNDVLFANGCPRQADGLTIGTPGASATNRFTLPSPLNFAPYDTVETGTDFVPESADWIQYTFLPAAATTDQWTVNFGVPGGVNVLPGDIINVCGQVFDYIGFFPVVPHTI